MSVDLELTPKRKRAAGALTKAEFHEALASAGFDGIEIRETHRLHEHAAAIIRARKRLDS